MAVSKDRKKELNRAAYLRKKEEKELAEKKSAPVGSEEMKRDREWALSLDAEGQRAPGEFYTYESLYEIFYGKHSIVPAKHSVKDEKLTFLRWLEFRQQCRTDLWFLAWCLGYRGLAEKPHRPIIDFFVRKDNTSLPLEYNLEELKDCLLKQDDQHFRLLLYPRGFFKSSLTLADACQWVLNFPDITILSVSSTKILSLKFVREFRNYFVVKDPDDPCARTQSGDFKILFPDFCIPEGTGKADSYRCPVAHLDQKEDTFSRTSIEAGTAGSRAHLIIFDDIQNEKNYKKATMRTEVRETYDAIRELAVPPFSFIQVAGTRWTDGQVGDDEVDGRPVAIPDVYGTILQRIKENGDDRWKVLVKSAWYPRESAEGKQIRDYVPEDVDMLWGENQGSFAVLLGKAKENLELFRCNQLNEPAGHTEDGDRYINTFTEDNIRKAMVHSSLSTGVQGRVYIFGDTAMTSGKKSDYSAFAVVKIQLREEGNPIIWYLEIAAGHWTDSQTAKVIADMMCKWQPDGGTLIEEIPSMSNWFKDEVKRQIAIRQCQHLPFRWFRPDESTGAKEGRIRGLQMLHEMGLLRFVIGHWIDLMMKQLLDYNGDKKRHKSSKSGRKDDIPDSMSFVFLPGILPYIEGVSKPEDEKTKKARAERQALLAQYNRIYGTSSPLRPQPTAVDLEDDKAHNPIHDALAPLFGNRMPRQAFPRKSEGN